MLQASVRARSAATSRWQQTLSHFETVGLDRITSAATDDRTDIKFILRADVMLELLDDLADEYSVLDIDGQRYTTYRTQYFDTESFSFFRRHHAGGCNRYKVRTRTYLNTRASYVEIKRKTGRGTTTKLRHQTEQFETELHAGSRQFIDMNCPTRAADLRPVLLNRFDRIQLVSKQWPERLTVDLDLEVEQGSAPVRLPGVAVAEFKRERGDRNHRDAGILKRMRSLNVRPAGFSKYCMCLLLTNDKIKHNRFKPQLRRLNRLMEEPNAHC